MTASRSDEKPLMQDRIGKFAVNRFIEGRYTMAELRLWSLLVFGVDLTEGLR